MADEEHPERSLGGKVAIVTGVADGFGRAVAEALGSAGARVVLVGEDADEARDAAANLERAHVDAADLQSVESMQALARRVEDRFGRIDVLANMVLNRERHDVMTCTPEAWDRALAITLRATFFMSQAVAPAMVRAGGGTVVNLAEDAAFRPAPRMAVDSAARGGVVSLTRTMAFELAHRHIRVNVVAPGGDDPRATPHDLAPAVLFLAGDASSGVTGACINVTRGGFMPH
jgi:NAD(P)-dependent dehydrogenase (short-subunit alcohol dehydrogenase family)